MQKNLRNFHNLFWILLYQLICLFNNEIKLFWTDWSGFLIPERKTILTKKHNQKRRLQKSEKQ